MVDIIDMASSSSCSHVENESEEQRKHKAPCFLTLIVGGICGQLMSLLSSFLWKPTQLWFKEGDDLRIGWQGLQFQIRDVKAVWNAQKDA